MILLAAVLIVAALLWPPLSQGQPDVGFFSPGSSQFSPTASGLTSGNGELPVINRAARFHVK